MTFFDYDPLKRDTLIDTDPFMEAGSQVNRMRAFCEVWLDEINITNKIEPHLISVRIIDGNQKEADVEIDDRDGMLPIPPLNATLVVLLGWARESMFKMFKGRLSDFEHSFGRKQGGRRMHIHAKGDDVVTSKLKQPMSDNMGDGAPPGQREGKPIPVNDWIFRLAKNAGINAQVDAYFKKFTQDHWQQMQESPYHAITSLTEKMGAMVQYDDGLVKIERPGSRGVSCHAIWGQNLIGWRVKPFQARSAWKGAIKDTYDANDGAWLQKGLDRSQQTTQNTPAAAAQASGGTPEPAATEGQADNANQGAVESMDSFFSGPGRIVINGEPAAQWNSRVVLEGARPGVDGEYLILVAEHIYSRQGYVTWLDVEVAAKAESSTNVYSHWPLPRPALNRG